MATGNFWAQPGNCCCGGGTPCCFCSTSPCPIPYKDLTLSWPGTGSTPAGSLILEWGGGGGWGATCTPVNVGGFTNYLSASLICNFGGNALLTTSLFPAGDPFCTRTPSTCSTATGLIYNAGVSTCSPYSVRYDISAILCSAFASANFVSFTLSDPSPVSAPVMCQRICVRVAGVPIVGATVSVYDTMGGTLLTSGTTGSDGCVSLSWTGTNGTYYITVTAAGHTSYGANNDLTCAHTLNISLLTMIAEDTQKALDAAIASEGSGPKPGGCCP